MSDLIKRLRDDLTQDETGWIIIEPLSEEAAAHIETLQAELAEARAKVERARGDALEEAANTIVAYCAAQNEAKKEASFVDAVRAFRSLAKG